MKMPGLGLQLLLRAFDQGYDQKAWHGPNLRGSIRGLDANVASLRPGADRRNIWEQVVHAAYWKYTVRRRLLGEKRGSFPLKGSNWFVRNGEAGADLWQSDIALLESTHRSLRSAIESLKDADLNKTPAGRKVSDADVIFGIAAHDVYHAGQIQLLKRLVLPST